MTKPVLQSSSKSATWDLLSFWQDLAPIPLVCSLAIWLQTNEWILSTSRLKHLFATDSFGLRPGPFPPVALLLYVQLAVNRQPGYRQGTRRARYCLPMCFLCVLLRIYGNRNFRVRHDELREDTAPRQVMHWTSPFACGKILSISNILQSLVAIVLTATEK